jgi:hypothetical protein
MMKQLFFSYWNRIKNDGVKLIYEKEIFEILFERYASIYMQYDCIDLELELENKN